MISGLDQQLFLMRIKITWRENIKHSKRKAHKYYGTGESKTIHQDMYETATRSGGTTIQLNPIGGSENYHER